MTKRWTSLLVLFLVSLSTISLALAYPVLAGPGQRPWRQTPGREWIVWEMADPPQSLLLEGNTLWVGSYKGGLYRWSTEAGYQAHYTATQGLTGEDVVGLARGSDGDKLVASVDGGLSVGSESFADLTPPGGRRAWDLAVTDGDDVWLATLGGGVARYAGGGWITTYTTANSSLPFDDVYAIAVEGTTPWAGTMGYGLARLSGGDWVTYTLPVEIRHPVTPTIHVTNSAIADIAVDGSGSKWLATDGSGVVVLSGDNSQWTVYDKSNSDLPDDFVHAITLDGDDRWFGTLGGGVARLDTGSSAWEVLNTANSPLPEDDVLAIAVEADGDQWFATFDAGLTFHGELPATPPTIDLDPFGAPPYAPGGAKSYYLWLDPQAYVWYLAWSGDGQDHAFSGNLVADASIISATAVAFEGGDSMAVDGNTLTITATEAISQDLVSFVLDRSVTQLTLNLKIDGAYRPFNIQVGAAREMPPTAPFRLAAPQPVPPAVAVQADQAIEEGEGVYLTGVLSDTDSPLGHQIAWQMGDGTSITDTLAPPHVYADDGLYDVTLTITDVHGEVGTGSAVITVTNVAPQPDFYTDPERPEPGQIVTLAGSAFDPGSGDVYTYVWDFGDGSPLLAEDGFTGTSALTVTHSYAITSDYDVTLSVVDDDGGVGAVSYTVSIEPFGADFVGFPAAGIVPFTATLYDTSAGMVTTRTWTFGDGSPAVTTDTATTVEHVYDAPGVYTASLSIWGPSGSDAAVRPNYIIALSPQVSGTLFLEAEDYTRQIPGPGPTWETRTARPGYSGSGYVQVTPDVNRLFDANAVGTGSELQYDLGLTITGTYTVWLRGLAPNAAGDSVYVGFDGQPLTDTAYISGFPPGAWAWRDELVEAGQVATFTVDTPGVHTLNLWVREDGFILDQVILTPDENFVPGE